MSFSLITRIFKLLNKRFNCRVRCLYKLYLFCHLDRNPKQNCIKLSPQRIIRSVSPRNNIALPNYCPVNYTCIVITVTSYRNPILLKVNLISLRANFQRRFLISKPKLLVCPQPLRGIPQGCIFGP